MEEKGFGSTAVIVVGTEKRTKQHVILKICSL